MSKKKVRGYPVVPKADPRLEQVTEILETCMHQLGGMGARFQMLDNLISEAEVDDSQGFADLFASLKREVLFHEGELSRALSLVWKVKYPGRKRPKKRSEQTESIE